MVAKSLPDERGGETGLPADSAIRKPCFRGSAREQR